MRGLRVTPPGRVPASRICLFAVVMLVWAVLVVLRLDDLQVVRSDQLRALVRRQHEKVINSDPRRGMILDRMGRELAVSTDVYSVYAAADEIEDKKAAARKLARVLDLPVSKVRSRLSSDGFVLLRRWVSPAVADGVKDLGLSGVHLVTESKRFYPRGRLASQVLGFVVPGEASLREGLERRYDPAIRGTPGTLLAMRDARGRHFLRKAMQKAEPGQDLVTSLDEVIQHLADRELEAAVRGNRARSGIVVVQHTTTGEILAMANYPDFNPNQYGRARAWNRRNRAITDYYEPGSTFKIITAAAALEEGLVRPSEIIDCQYGAIRVGQVTIKDHKAFGPLSFADAIAHSSNVCLIKVGLRLDPHKYHDYITRFGFGSRTGVDLPGESRGLLRPVSQWSRSSQAFIAFGQEIGVTVLQLTSAFSAVGNKGVLVPPRIVTRIIQDEGKRVRVPDRPTPRRVISERTAETLTDLMEGVVTYGTGRNAAVPGFRVAGKTGTAQKIVDGAYSPDRFVASFCGFVPARDPVLTICAVLDDPREDEYYGGEVAAPLFARIAAPALAYLGVPRRDRNDELVELASMGAGRSDPETGRDGRSGIERAVAAASARARASRSSKDARPLQPRALDPNAPAPAQAGRSGRVPGTVPVPDLFRAPLRDAVVLLAKNGLEASVTGEGFVARQHPEAGTPLPEGSVVRLELARLVTGEPPAPGAVPGARSPSRSPGGRGSGWKEARLRLRGGEGTAHEDR